MECDHARFSADLRDVERREELQAQACTVMDGLSEWRSTGVREEVLAVLELHAGPLRDSCGAVEVPAASCRAHAYALGALLSFVDDDHAGHLATDLFELVADWQPVAST